MTSKIKNFRDFIGHIRAAQTIDDISMNLERFMDFYSSDYADEFLESYIGEAKKLLDEFSMQITKMADEEIVKKNDKPEQTQSQSSSEERT